MTTADEKYSKNTIYIISYAQLPDNMSVTLAYKFVGIGFVIDYTTGYIVDTACTYLTEEARKFVKDMVVGHNLDTEGIDPIIEDVKKRFHGPSQKSLCVVMRDNYNKYINIKRNLIETND